MYVIDEQWDITTVLAVRKRPPYNYDDLRWRADQILAHHVRALLT
jgi:hypothetical protein